MATLLDFPLLRRLTPAILAALAIVPLLMPVPAQARGVRAGFAFHGPRFFAARPFFRPRAFFGPRFFFAPRPFFGPRVFFAPRPFSVPRVVVRPRFFFVP